MLILRLETVTGQSVYVNTDKVDFVIPRSGTDPKELNYYLKVSGESFQITKKSWKEAMDRLYSKGFALDCSPKRTDVTSEKKVSASQRETLEDNGYVDLGLPSGKKWASQNEEGFHTFDEAMEKFGKNLPTKEDLKELYHNCKFAWDSKRKGCVFKGPNGKTIFFPAAGWRDGSTVRNANLVGYYWSSSMLDQNCANGLTFSEDVIFPDNLCSRDYGLSVRFVK